MPKKIMLESWLSAIRPSDATLWFENDIELLQLSIKGRGDFQGFTITVEQAESIVRQLTKWLSLPH